MRIHIIRHRIHLRRHFIATYKEDGDESLCAVPALSKKRKIPPRYSLQKNLLFRLYARSAPKEKSAPETNKRSPITGQLA